MALNGSGKAWKKLLSNTTFGIKHNRKNKGNFHPPRPRFSHGFPRAKRPKGPVGRTPSAEVLLLIPISWASPLSQFILSRKAGTGGVS